MRLTYADDRFLGLLQSRIYGNQGDVVLENNQVGSGTEGAVVFDLTLGYSHCPRRAVGPVPLTLSIPLPGIRTVVWAPFAGIFLTLGMARLQRFGKRCPDDWR